MKICSYVREDILKSTWEKTKHALLAMFWGIEYFINELTGFICKTRMTPCISLKLTKTIESENDPDHVIFEFKGKKKKRFYISDEWFVEKYMFVCVRYILLKKRYNIKKHNKSVEDSFGPSNVITRHDDSFINKQQVRKIEINKCNQYVINSIIDPNNLEFYVRILVPKDDVKYVKLTKIYVLLEYRHTRYLT